MIAGRIIETLNPLLEIMATAVWSCDCHESNQFPVIDNQNGSHIRLQNQPSTVSGEGNRLRNIAETSAKPPINANWFDYVLIGTQAGVPDG